ncbi:MAG: Rpn family recombination-promoting nuclease/putative transposase [Candidatus Ornithomonoglobus sp.]
MKFTRLDLNLTTNKGLINVEIQISNNGDFPERGLYYWAQRYGRQLKKGDSYSDIQPTISIYIVDFKMFDTDSFYSFYTMADIEHNKILTDKCAMYFFELPKLDKNYDAKNRRKLWMQLINAESEAELDMLDKTQVPEIQDGVRIIYDLSADTLVREQARRREERLLEERSALSYARRQGRDDLLAALREMGIDEATLQKAAARVKAD